MGRYEHLKVGRNSVTLRFSLPGRVTGKFNFWLLIYTETRIQQRSFEKKKKTGNKKIERFALSYDKLEQPRRVWTRVSDSLSYDDNRYAECASIIVYVCMYVCVYHICENYLSSPSKVFLLEDFMMNREAKLRCDKWISFFESVREKGLFC